MAVGFNLAFKGLKEKHAYYCGRGGYCCLAIRRGNTSSNLNALTVRQGRKVMWVRMRPHRQ
jgi:hypothetical protein